MSGGGGARGHLAHVAISFWQLFVLALMYHCTLAFELGIFYYFF